MNLSNPDYDRLLILCKMFIEESYNLKQIINNMYEEMNEVSNAMNYLNQHQNRILENIAQIIKAEHFDFDSMPSFHYIIKYTAK